jgi:hypothetical protein
MAAMRDKAAVRCKGIYVRFSEPFHKRWFLEMLKAVIFPQIKNQLRPDANQ